MIDSPTQFATSPDGSRIAYDQSGSGPALVLLHGGGQTRRVWKTAGWIERLQARYRVVSIDIRGSGESDKPVRTQDYAIERHAEDILAVADGCGIDRFRLWGYSYGGNVGRFLAVTSPRVVKFVLGGIPLGAAAAGMFRDRIIGFRDHWTPLLRGLADGTISASSLGPTDRAQFDSGGVPLALAWFGAILDWPAYEPSDFVCPTLWLVGSRNDGAMASVAERAQTTVGTQVHVAIADGLDHEQEMSQVDEVAPLVLPFLSG